MSRVKKKPKKEFSKVWLGCVGAVTLIVTAFTLAIVWKTGDTTPLAYLIPVNPVRERDFVRPSRKNALNFKNKLEKSGINVTIRREMGSDIDGACGQLRRSYVKADVAEGEEV